MMCYKCHEWYHDTCIKGGPARPRTPLLGFAISKTTRDILMRQFAREVLSSPACMYNLDASAFYIKFVPLHEYFTQKAKLLPYTTELSLQTWSISFSQQSRRNDSTFFKTASLEVRFFTINDIIASVVAVKFRKDLTSGNSCVKFCLIPVNTD